MTTLAASPAANVKGAAFARYLLFESSFTQELMALGRADTLQQREEVVRFFGWSTGSLTNPVAAQTQTVSLRPSK